MTKFTITATGFKPLRKGTLVGFADVVIPELKLKIHDVTLLEKNGSRWAAMPSRPWLKGGVAVRGDDGKVQYSPLFEF